MAEVKSPLGAGALSPTPVPMAPMTVFQSLPMAAMSAGETAVMSDLKEDQSAEDAAETSCAVVVM
ncbi:MAG: hypothetical protein PW788_14240 [Micavibrio sp.]|nr:hypothetical protein [Micavibrio sp.]